MYIQVHKQAYHLLQQQKMNFIPLDKFKKNYMDYAQYSCMAIELINVIIMLTQLKTLLEVWYRIFLLIMIKIHHTQSNESGVMKDLRLSGKNPYKWGYVLWTRVREPVFAETCMSSSRLSAHLNMTS